jgi:hypothetical protein
MFGSYVLTFSIALLIGGLVLLWIHRGFLGALVGVAAYFLVLPILTLPLLRALDLVPPRAQSQSPD